MRILITGGTGFIGKELCRELASRGHDLVLVSRNPDRYKYSFSVPADFVKWSGHTEPFPVSALDGVDALINLAGEPIADKYWTPSVRRKIRVSRAEGTSRLREALEALPAGQRPKVFINASAIGFYGDRSDEGWLTEDSHVGQGFLSEVCQAWEKEAARAGALCRRLVIIRIGLVLGKKGGLLQRMLPPFRAGFGVVLGSGKNWMSWIHIKDLARTFAEAVEGDSWVGIFNGVSPSPVRQEEFASLLAKALGKKGAWKVPAAILRLALGEMSSLMLGSQRVKPSAAQSRNFKFEYNDLEAAFSDLIALRE